jgi:hypothetical protein
MSDIIIFRRLLSFEASMDFVKESLSPVQGKLRDLSAGERSLISCAATGSTTEGI